MPDQQFRFERVGMIEVDLSALLRRVAIEVAVVRIVRDPLDAVFADAVVDGARDGRFARSGAAGDADDDRSFHRDWSSNSASVMNSATSSLPHVLQMIESSFPFGPNSNRYVGVSHSRQMRYSGSSMGAKNTRCRAAESYLAYCPLRACCACAVVGAAIDGWMKCVWF